MKEIEDTQRFTLGDFIIYKMKECVDTEPHTHTHTHTYIYIYINNNNYNNNNKYI